MLVMIPVCGLVVSSRPVNPSQKYRKTVPQTLGGRNSKQPTKDPQSVLLGGRCQKTGNTEGSRTKIEHVLGVPQDLHSGLDALNSTIKYSLLSLTCGMCSVGEHLVIGVYLGSLETQRNPA